MTDAHTTDPEPVEPADTSATPVAPAKDVGADEERAETLEVERQAREQARVGQAVRGPKP